MSLPAHLALDRRAIPWLFVVALATTLPHGTQLPLTLSATVLLFFSWAGWLWWKGSPLPSRWLLMLCVAAFSGGILFEYRTLFGRDAGVCMLAGFMALKMLEIRSRRDAHVVVILGFFLLLTHYFYSQTIPVGLWLLFCSVLLTATLIRLAGGAASPLWPTLRYGGVMVLQATPFLLVLYLLFPRVSGPLWGLPQDAFKAKTGLSESMAPGNISELAQSGEIAFRVLFAGEPPPRNTLYWRGPVLEQYNGQRWQASTLRSRDPEPTLEVRGPAYPYTITLESQNQRWLLALDAPTDLPAGTHLDPTLVALSDNPLTQRSRFDLKAHPDYRFNADEEASVLQRNLALPPTRNPQTRALAALWRSENAQAAALVAKALRHFREEEFVYTLRPPLLGPEGIDDFLFRTRRGFCEHYAAAFVVLMRAAGVPARVVTGYQGGERNPLDDYFVIRQSDAHAWAEVWMVGKGWVRVDPTAAVSPARIESNIAAALPDSEPLPALIQIQTDWLRDLRYRWEFINNGWNQWVLGYNPDRQRELLSRLGLPADWAQLGALLTAVCGALLLVLAGWVLYHRPRVDAARKLWLKALQRLRRRGLDVADWEAPLAIAQGVALKSPEQAAAFERVVAHYCTSRYGAPADRPLALAALKLAVADLT